MLRKYSFYLFLVSLFVATILGHFFRNIWLQDTVQWSVWGACLLGLLLYFVMSLEHLRNWLKKRQAQFGISLAITAISVLAILTLVNWFSIEKNKKFDLTRNSIHSLSDQSVNVLKNLKEKVIINIWTTNVAAMSGKRDAQRFFENYHLSGGDNVEVNFLNPINDPQGAQENSITQDNVIIISSASGREIRVDNFNDAKAEEQITNGIINAIKGQQKTLCFLSGHGELSISKTDAAGLSFVKDSLEKSSYKTEELTLLSETSVPERCEALVIAGPESEPAEAEFDMIQSYLKDGGRLLALFGVGVPNKWHKLVENFGVKIMNNVVVDPRVQRPPLSVLTKNYSSDVDIVKSFSTPVFFTFANSIKVPTDSNKEGVSIKTFISSESSSYAKSGNLETVGRDFSQHGGDLTGPLPIAVLISKKIKVAHAGDEKDAGESKDSTEKEEGQSQEGSLLNLDSILEKVLEKMSFVSTAHAEGSGEAPSESSINAKAVSDEDVKDEAKAEEKEMSVVLIGNHLFAANGLVTQMGNMDLFLNSISHLFKDNELIGIRPKEIGSAKLEITADNIYQVRGYIFLAALTFIVLGVWAIRRRRASA